MTAAFFLTALILGLILVPLCFVQLLFLETLRLRHRDSPAFEFFRQNIEARLEVKPDRGALTFSLIKHFLLLGLAIVLYAAIEESGVPLLAGRPQWQVIVESAFVSALAMVLVAHLLPHLLYRRTTGAWLMPLVPILKVAATAVRPFVGLLDFVESLADLGSPETAAEENGSPAEDIEALITAGTEEGLIEEEDRKLIKSVVEFGDKTVREVMTPRPQMVTVPIDAALEQVRELVVREQYSRIPVTDGSIDNIAGFIHVRDVFAQDYDQRATQKVTTVMRKIDFVPETKPVGPTLQLMQKRGIHMVIVVDEYGQTAGLATMEDLVEEIVGEIRDEHEPTLDVAQDELGRFLVSGNLDLDRLHELLEFRPQEGIESTTIGGLVTEWMGRVPTPGESVERDGLRIEILAADERRVSQVRLSRVELPEPEA